MFDSSYISGGDVRIEKDPDMTKLAQEARRLSMGQTPPSSGDNNRRTSNTPPSNGRGPRRPSEGTGGSRDDIQCWPWKIFFDTVHRKTKRWFIRTFYLRRGTSTQVYMSILSFLSSSQKAPRSI